MEATKKRNIRSGDEYNHFFPKAEGATSTIRKDANVTHTVAFIPKVVNETLHHTKKLSAALKGQTLNETCSNIWQFVYQHIAYKKDQEGYEQIRSPARAWHDRKTGVDCDCYSVFISSILTNLKVPHILRITKYHRDYFQHIYPVVPFHGTYIILDCVTDGFNYEVPFSEKKDYSMDLQYLNGFDGDDGMEELGKLFGKKLFAKNKTPLPTPTSSSPQLTIAKKKAIPALFQKIKTITAPKAASSPAQPGVPEVKKPKGIKKILNVVNKVNPATVLLRNGILASMKLNIKNVAKRLRWSYLSQEEAVKKGIDPSRFQRLVATRQKLENLFYGAGGKPENLKKAILSGKGNQDKAVNGLGMMGLEGIGYMDYNTSLTQLLGRDVYYSENVEGFEGLGQLGEPITLTSIAAASGVVAAIVASLKQIGDIFTKKTEGSQDFDEKLNEAAENNAPVPDTTPVPQTATNPIVPTTNPVVPIANSLPSPIPVPAITNEAAFIPDEPVEQSENYPMPVVVSNTLPVVTNTNLPMVIDAGQQSSIAPSASTGASTPDTKQSIWDKNKWLKPVAIGVGGIGIIAIGYALLKPKEKGRKTSSKSSSLSGIPHRKRKTKNKNHHRKQKSKPSKKTAVALL